jgi:hypothetical protein
MFVIIVFQIISRAAPRYSKRLRGNALVPWLRMSHYSALYDDEATGEGGSGHCITVVLKL